MRIISLAPEPLLAARLGLAWPCFSSIIFTVRVGLGVEAGILRFRYKELLPLLGCRGGVLSSRGVRSIHHVKDYLSCKAASSKNWVHKRNEKKICRNH